MSSETGSTPFPISDANVGAEASSSSAAVIARQDRIPIWSLSYLFIGIIGIGFLFTFFDIFDINVSFIQTCVALVGGCTPQSSANYLGLLLTTPATPFPLGLPFAIAGPGFENG